MAGKNESSFEDHLKALERVVADLEGDTLSLEASIGRYKEGVSHLGACRKILDAAEQRLCELVAAPGGGFEEVPLRVGAEGLEDAPPPEPRVRREARPGPPSPPSRPGSPPSDLPF